MADHDIIFKIGQRVMTPHGIGVVVSIGHAYGATNYGVELLKPVCAALGMISYHAVAIAEDMRLIQIEEA